MYHQSKRYCSGATAQIALVSCRSHCQTQQSRSSSLQWVQQPTPYSQTTTHLLPCRPESSVRSVSRHSHSVVLDQHSAWIFNTGSTPCCSHTFTTCDKCRRRHRTKLIVQSLMTLLLCTLYRWQSIYANAQSASEVPCVSRREGRGGCKAAGVCAGGDCQDRHHCGLLRVGAPTHAADPDFLTLPQTGIQCAGTTVSSQFS